MEELRQKASDNIHSNPMIIEYYKNFDIQGLIEIIQHDLYAEIDRLMDTRRSQKQPVIDYEKDSTEVFYNKYREMIKNVNKEIQDNSMKKNYRFNFNDCYFFKDEIVDSRLNIRKLLQKTSCQSLRHKVLRSFYIYSKKKEYKNVIQVIEFSSLTDMIEKALTIFNQPEIKLIQQKATSLITEQVQSNKFDISRSVEVIEPLMNLRKDRQTAILDIIGGVIKELVCYLFTIFDKTFIMHIINSVQKDLSVTQGSNEGSNEILDTVVEMFNQFYEENRDTVDFISESEIKGRKVMIPRLNTANMDKFVPFAFKTINLKEGIMSKVQNFHDVDKTSDIFDKKWTERLQIYGGYVLNPFQTLIETYINSHDDSQITIQVCEYIDKFVESLDLQSFMETTKNDIKKLTEYIKEETKGIDLEKFVQEQCNNAEGDPALKKAFEDFNKIREDFKEKVSEIK
jgi:hypothetical protein